MKKIVNGKLVEMTPEEVEELNKLIKENENMEQNRPPTLEEEVATLKKENETLTQCILEMSMLVYQ